MRNVDISVLKETLAKHPEGLEYQALQLLFHSHHVLPVLVALSLTGDVKYVDGRYRLTFEEWVRAVA